MRFARLVIAMLAAIVPAGSAAADDSGNFIVRLGRDTVSVEHYTRSATRVVVDQVGRAPRVLRRHFVYDYANGELTRLSMVVTPPGATAPTQTIDAAVDSDSLRLHVQSGTNPPVNSSLGLPVGTLVQATSSLWTGYETQIMKLVQGKADSLRGTQYFLGADTVQWFSLHRLEPDSVAIATERGDLFHACVDKAGRVIGVLPIAGTGQFSVDRVGTLDLDAMAASYDARQQAGAGIGVLSPRDTVRAENAGGASLWIDYGRPAKRGRAIFGNVVPFGTVWRTGANAATQFKTDKPLGFGGTVVPAGFYTLWTIPTTAGWTLVINSETGQWGTEHHAEKDLFRIGMASRALPQEVERFTINIVPYGRGGALNFDWDTTRASVEFTVVP